MSLGFVAAAPPETDVAGRLELAVRRAAGRTVPEHVAHAGVLRLMKPHYLDETGQATAIVVNPGGAYFPETYELDVALREGAALVLTTQSATRVHRTEGGPAVQRLAIRLEAGARLEYLPDSLIAYHDAQYRQFTEILLDPTASLFLGEILTPGWHPDGVRFSYADVHLRTALSTLPDAPGRLVCVDNLRVTPPVLGDDLAGIGHLEGFSHLGSVLLAGPHVDDAHVERVREATTGVLPRGEVGVTAGESHGVRWAMVRALADSTDDLRALTQAVNTLDRRHTTGQGPLDLRRY